MKLDVNKQPSWVVLKTFHEISCLFKLEIPRAYPLASVWRTKENLFRAMDGKLSLNECTSQDI